MSAVQMRVEIESLDGTMKVEEAKAVRFVKVCRNCKAEFKTNDPRKEYHSVECREGAKYVRRVKSGWG